MISLDIKSCCGKESLGISNIDHGYCVWVVIPLSNTSVINFWQEQIREQPNRNVVTPFVNELLAVLASSTSHHMCVRVACNLSQSQSKHGPRSRLTV